MLCPAVATNQYGFHRHHCGGGGCAALVRRRRRCHSPHHRLALVAAAAALHHPGDAGRSTARVAQRGCGSRRRRRHGAWVEPATGFPPPPPPLVQHSQQHYQLACRSLLNEVHCTRVHSKMRRHAAAPSTNKQSLPRAKRSRGKDPDSAMSRAAFYKRWEVKNTWNSSGQTTDRQTESEAFATWRC